MKRYWKTAAALGCCAVTALFWACGRQGLPSKLSKGKETETYAERPAWERYAETPVTLDWYVNFSWFKTGWGENLVSRAITEETGVTLNFLTPTGSETEKINSMIASGTLPDIVTLGWWEPSTQKMVEEDMVYALNELAQEYDPYFFEVADPDTARWYTKEDGNLYCFPNSSYTPKDCENDKSYASNQNFLVRKDIYEAIGSPDMTTQEGFAAAVRAAAEQFPEVDGYPLIPIGAEEFKQEGSNSFDKYLQNFLAVPFEEDGEFADRFQNEDYISWLKMFRALAQEGYLADDVFVDRRTQIEEKISQGRYFCMFYQGQDMLDQQKTLYDRDPEMVYMAVDGPKNSAGSDPTLPGMGANGWTVTFISKNCEHPERAIAFLSYLISERGQKMVYLGVEGEMYEMKDGAAVNRPEVQELLETNRAEYDRLYGADDAYWMLQDNVMQMQWGLHISEAERQIKEWTRPYTIYGGIYETNFETGSEEAGIYTKVLEEWGQTLPKLLLSASDEEFDEVWEQFLEKRDSLGYDKVLEEQTQQMKRNKEKLGVAQQ